MGEGVRQTGLFEFDSACQKRWLLIPSPVGWERSGRGFPPSCLSRNIFLMANDSPAPHRRRPRYAGKYPRRFEEKYKERDPERHAETVSRVLASGKTPAGTHRPIM